MIKPMMLLLWLVLSFPAAAQNAPTVCDDEDAYSMVDILDPGVPAAVRSRNLDMLKRYALEHRCPDARYSLGLLYRHGSDLPGNLVKKDVAEARRLLEDYALDGYLQAFADLAELALEQEQAQEAMQWTQVYLYLVTQHDGTLNDFERRGYNADLLKRAYTAWRKAGIDGGQDAINAVFNDYLQPRKAELVARFVAKEQEIEQYRNTLGERGEGEELRVKDRDFEVRTFNPPSTPGYATYLLEVQPDGSVSRIVTESFAPSPEHGKKLRRFIEGVTFYPFDGDKPQVARIPVQNGYDDGPLKLKKQRKNVQR